MEKDEAKRNYSLRNHGMQIQHMFRDTGAFLDELRDFLRNSASFMTFFSTVLAMKIPALHHDPLFEAVSNAQRQVQDLRDLTTKILTNIGDNLETIDRIHVSEADFDSEGTRSGKSTRDIVEEFKLQRAVENLRLFYVVLQLAAFALATSVVVGSAANLLWDLVPPGRTAEAVISGVSVLSWLLQAGAVATVSTCPIDELDFNSFVESRPAVCICLGLGPLVSGAFRSLVQRCEEVVGKDGWMGWDRTDAWLAIHASAAVLLAVWLQCRKTKDTIRVYANSYMAMSWGSSFYACRAVDLALGHKECGQAALLLPLLLVLVVGRKVLFQKLVYLLDHRRRLQLRDGAFMAMLLDSYVVEPGQPWWLSLEEIAQKSTSGSHTLAACSSLPTARLEGKSPGFVVGRVTEVAEVQRFQQVLPWPESLGRRFALRVPEALRWVWAKTHQHRLLRRGRQKLRCLDWAAQNPEHWRPETLGEYQLSRPLQRGETIDYFVSHSWSDSPERKWRALQLVADSFYRLNGRYPTFWVDKFCIDQRELADGLRVLPVNVMSCRSVLCLCGKTFPTRLWCAWELCVLLSFSSIEQALQQLVVENKIQALGQMILDRETGVSEGLLVPDKRGLSVADSEALGVSHSTEVEEEGNEPMVQVSF
eukprot:g29840.t1